MKTGTRLLIILSIATALIFFVNVVEAAHADDKGLKFPEVKLNKNEQILNMSWGQDGALWVTAQDTVTNKVTYRSTGICESSDSITVIYQH